MDKAKKTTPIASTITSSMVNAPLDQSNKLGWVLRSDFDAAQHRSFDDFHRN
jgi:hypothetical protein